MLTSSDNPDLKHVVLVIVYDVHLLARRFVIRMTPQARPDQIFITHDPLVQEEARNLKENEFQNNSLHLLMRILIYILVFL